ncbi:MAG: DoxX family protein [Simkaniaceae bacterium]|nr:DoxX family protein [Simkaniaceae bacterium]MCF7852668.1 DoxX family protein [Simkaniaceae bacterium]
MKYILLIGRILFSSVFIIKGIDHFTPAAITYASSMNVPIPGFLVPLAGVIAVLGGLSILLGFKARIGAWLIIIFLIPTTFMMHQYWSFKDLYHAMMNQYCFIKNLSLMGAALMIAYFGSGPFSLSHNSHRS